MAIRPPRSQQPAPSQCSITDASRCQRSQLCSLKVHQQFSEAIRCASHRKHKWSSSNSTSLRKRSAAARCSSRSPRRYADRRQTCQTHRLANGLTAPTPAHLPGIYVAKIWLAASKKYGATVVLYLLTMSQLVLVLLNTMRAVF